MRQPPPLEQPFQFEQFRTALRDGTGVLVRPLTPDDKPLIRDGFARLSPESRYFRFMSPMDELSEELLDRLTSIDHVNHFAWIAVRADRPTEGLGVARYVRLQNEPHVAEAAVTVIDAYQGRGLGTLLLALLATAARASAITSFRAYVLEANVRMRALLEALGANATFESRGMLRMDVPLDPDRLPDSPPARVLEAVARGVVGPVATPVDTPRSGTDSASASRNREGRPFEATT